MLPLHQAQEIKDSLKAYLRASFDFIQPGMKEAFEAFVDDPENGLFKGPYVSVKLPFVKASSAAAEAIPLDVKPSWAPFRHQVLSWERLSVRNGEPEPTLVTTGTGSGKTESFLYPVLDYCMQKQEQPGVKCIILYPMNALATDQAKRLAEIIHGDARLQGKVTAGLFIGDSSKSSLPTQMGEDHVVENRDAIVSDPPDILLTNFKMLDYGLMQSRFDRLWMGNREAPELLRFLVLDEMHTYDGAQGTDVANLIRRLKLKLNIPKGQICPVGTSATLGSGDDAARELAAYATTLFGETVSESAVITESRVTLDDYFGPPADLAPFLPRVTFLSKVQVDREADYDDYIDRLTTLWQQDRHDLAAGLRTLRVAADLVAACNTESGIHRLDHLMRAVAARNSEFAKFRADDQQAMLLSLIALIGAAREASGLPMLFVQVQIWVRELSGVRRRLTLEPDFVWRDAPAEIGEPKHLPPWYCRECGTSGWLASKSDHRNALNPADGEGTANFFANDKKTHFLLPSSVLSRESAAAGGYDTGDCFEMWLNPATLELFEREEEGRMQVFGARRLDAKGKNDHICPSCNTRNSLSLVGSRVATMGSISVSQALASDFDESPERDRKVLAFTNSVQDAAHQAGFIEARNYRFTMRASIQRVLNLQTGPVRLPALLSAFKQHWLEYADDQGRRDISAYFNRFFPKDYIGRSEPEDYKQGNSYLPLFIEAFDERIGWEIMNEFGFESQLGRTLEKTGCAGAWLDPERIEAAAAELAQWVEQEVGSGQIPSADLPRFIALIAHRMRSRGAIEHSLLRRFREGRFERHDLNWLNSQSHILHRWFGANTRLPRMVIHEHHTAGMADTTHSSRSARSGSPNWFHAYLIKTFDLANNSPSFVNEFFRRLFDAGTASGLFHALDGPHGKNHALNPEALLVAKHVEDFRCTTCGHTVHEGATSEKLGLAGGKCLMYRCTGTYEPMAAAKEPNYYQLVYNRSRSPRVYALEHTGLLERKAREIVERDFKNRTKFNAPNALVATSTLEMGIDIGSLQMAFNTSVPPTPASFLQRVGRAGRSSGTALIVNFATSRAHDQYYFAEPTEMMAGEVSAPGCYLEALEILRRHYFAFCIDTWTSRDPQQHRIPTFVRHLKLLVTDVEAPEFFLNNILSFADTHQAELLERFKGIYQGEVSEATLKALESWVQSPTFQSFHQMIFKRLKSELQGLQKEKVEIGNRIQRERLGEGDDLFKELMREQKALGGMMHLVVKRAVLEHLTNVGALPNYAFPETGVTLNARVFKQTGLQALRSPLSKEYVIVRSASQALRELVPGSAFYSQSYRFEIGGLNLNELRAEGERHMRFCSNCDHIEESVTAIEHVACPKCGDESWMANSNRHRVAQLISVRSSTSSSKSRLADRHETRQSTPFSISRHFKFNRSAGAYAIPNASFGIEFHRSTEVTEFNMGYEGGPSQGDVIEINSTKHPRHGFITCKSCGKSAPSKQYEAKDYHYGYCPHVDVAWGEATADVFHELFLFRRMTTESLKVLAPVQELVTHPADLDLFQAGLELGFKRYFKGNPQHLLVRPYQEFNKATGKKDLYLVILDQVPGGTGYLERLFDPEEFSKVLLLAFEAMKECSCQFEGKDGCYRCVFSYSNQRMQEELSRAAGVDLFQRIVDRLGSWERWVDGLDALGQTGRLEESELETKFIQALRKYARQQPSWSFEEERVDGDVHYVLRMGADRHFHIQPQVELGAAQGFTSPTRPDYMLTATRFIQGGQERREFIPQVAIFLDGFAFHASQQHARFEGDIAKREQLRMHPGYVVWTLTWSDLVRFESGLSPAAGNPSQDFLAEALTSGSIHQHIQLFARANHEEVSDFPQLLNNMQRLIRALERGSWGDEDRRSDLGWMLGCQSSLFRITFDNSADALDTYLDAAQKSPERNLDVWVPLELPFRSCKLFNVTAVANWRQSAVVVRWELLNTNEVQREEWEAFWTWYNVLQHWPWNEWRRLPATYGLSAAVSDDQLSLAAESDAHPWLQEMLDYFTSYQPQIQALWDGGYFQSDDDETALTELMNERGVGIAGAEFIDPRMRKVYVPSSEEDEQVFVKHGYEVVAR